MFCEILHRYLGIWSNTHLLQSLLTSSSMSKLIYFVPSVCWYTSSGNLDFHKGSLIHRCLSKTVFSRGSQSVVKKSWAHSWLWGLYAYYSMHKCGQFLPGPLSWRWIPQLPQGTFVHGWILDCCCWGDTMRGRLIQAWCWCPPPGRYLHTEAPTGVIRLPQSRQKYLKGNSTYDRVFTLGNSWLSFLGDI